MSKNTVAFPQLLVVGLTIAVSLWPAAAFAATGGGGGAIGAFFAGIGSDAMGVIEGPIVRWGSTIAFATTGVSMLLGGPHAKEKLFNVLIGCGVVAASSWVGSRASGLMGYVA